MAQKRFLLLLIILSLSWVVTVVVGQQTAQSSATIDLAGRPSETAGATSEGFSLQLQAFATGLDRPVGLASAGDYRLFVIEQDGRIMIIERDGGLVATPFLDISDRVDSSGPEEGLLGLAFHPEYNANGLFYVNYTNTLEGVCRTRISSFQVTQNQYIADPDSESILLTVDQPEHNHNAGKISFGPDGYLYIPLGDGGGGGDSANNAQNPHLLLGKISRIDVNSGPGASSDCVGRGSGQYSVPASNPFIDGPGDSCDEIWAIGLRNPWQSSFDALTGDFFIGDVGQSKFEEVNFQPAGSIGGENYGWRCYEGSEEFNTAGCGEIDTFTFPIFEYSRPTPYNDCSVTGGYVYRGRQFPALYGRYVLTDYCSGRFWDLLHLPDGSWQSAEHNGPGLLRFGNAAFGERCDGELFVANVVEGELYHLTAVATLSSRAQRRAVVDNFTPDSWAYLPLISTSGCRGWKRHNDSAGARHRLGDEGSHCVRAFSQNRFFYGSRRLNVQISYFVRVGRNEPAARRYLTSH